MRVLCFTNMYPTKAEPWLGSFVRELVEAVRALSTSVTVLASEGRRRKRAYAEAVSQLRRAFRQEPFQLFHAHYGRTGMLAVSPVAEPLALEIDDSCSSVRTGEAPRSSAELRDGRFSA